MMNIELDEHAKKQTEAAQGVTAREAVGADSCCLRPGIVSRGGADAISEPEADGPAPDHPSTPSMNEPPTPARSTPDA